MRTPATFEAVLYKKRSPGASTSGSAAQPFHKLVRRDRTVRHAVPPKAAVMGASGAMPAIPITPRPIVYLSRSRTVIGPRCIMHRVERTSRIVEHLAIGEFRQPVVNGLVETQCAFLDEHHHRDGRHRLRHGRQAEDRGGPCARDLRAGHGEVDPEIRTAC